MEHNENSRRGRVESTDPDRIFDEGDEDVLQYFEVGKVQHPWLVERTVAVVLPVQVFEASQRESDTTEISIEDLVEKWIVEKVDLAAA